MGGGSQEPERPGRAGPAPAFQLWRSARPDVLEDALSTPLRACAGGKRGGRLGGWARSSLRERGWTEEGCEWAPEWGRSDWECELLTASG